MDALDDPEWYVRDTAIRGLIAFRKEPDVRLKLAKVAASDPHFQTQNGRSEFSVRQSAARVLAMESDGELVYVMRTAAGECRIQQAKETPVGIPFIGPTTDANHDMCTHVDDTRKDPSMCWTVAPRNACAK